MVNQVERSYMLDSYALDARARVNAGIRRRLAPLLAGDRRRIEVLNGLLMALPGSPFIYYGDEIGMGDNVYLGDRNGVRTPMHWTAGTNGGFSEADPEQLYLPVVANALYGHHAVNVASQQRSPSSLLRWMQKLIRIRRSSRALGRGSFELLEPQNHRVLAFVRRYQDETVLGVFNLAASAQFVALDLSALDGAVPVEMFGNSPFPRIGSEAYVLSLGPHDFFWFRLRWL
jgi:maltose alpha-D-glucosyltransferase/alpha-amylase